MLDQPCSSCVKKGLRCEYPNWQLAVPWTERDQNIEGLSSIDSDAGVQYDSGSSIDSPGPGSDAPVNDTTTLWPMPQRTWISASTMGNVMQQNFEYFERITLQSMSSAGPVQVYRTRLHALFMTFSLDEPSLQCAFAALGSVSRSAKLSSISLPCWLGLIAPSPPVGTSQHDQCNSYNTRAACFKSKLPYQFGTIHSSSVTSPRSCERVVMRRRRDRESVGLHLGPGEHEVSLGDYISPSVDQISDHGMLMPALNPAGPESIHGIATRLC